MAIAKFLILAGRFLQSVPVLVMRPKDLVSYSRSTYSHPFMVRMYSEPSCVDSGLSVEEHELVSMLPNPAGRLLLLGSGGGRDAIGLAKLGFDVSALDFCEEQIRAASINAERHGVTLKVLVQDMTNLNLAQGSYDIVWLSPYLFSSIPTRRWRQAMAVRIASALKPRGIFVCQFRYKPGGNKKKSNAWRKAVAWLTLGNFWYETGDSILGDREFIHDFISENEVLAEVTAAGFKKLYAQLLPNKNCGAILFEKIPENQSITSQYKQIT